jgi:hypothetical protein
MWIASGISSGWVAHQTMMLFNFISSSAMALISTSSASTMSGSLMNLQHRIDDRPQGNRLAVEGAGREMADADIGTQGVRGKRVSRNR